MHIIMNQKLPYALLEMEIQKQYKNFHEYLDNDRVEEFTDMIRLLIESYGWDFEEYLAKSYSEINPSIPKYHKKS